VLIVRHACTLGNETHTSDDYPGAVSAAFRGINDEGEVVGTNDEVNGPRHGFRFSGDAYRAMSKPIVAPYAMIQNSGRTGAIPVLWLDGIRTRGPTSVRRSLWSCKTIEVFRRRPGRTLHKRELL
jgi:probable HAF family extracellular repeat protein